MARGCDLIDSRLDTAKIGSDGRVEVHRARLLAVFGGTKNVSTRPGPKADLDQKRRSNTDFSSPVIRGGPRDRKTPVLVVTKDNAAQALASFPKPFASYNDPFASLIGK